MDIPHGERAHHSLIKAHEDEAENRKPSQNARHSKVHIKFEHLPRTDTGAFIKHDPRKFRDQISASTDSWLVGPDGTRDQCPKRNRGAIPQLRFTLPMPHNPHANQVILVEPLVERVEMPLIGQVQELKLA